jgi:circadian clock protein KaiC
MPRARPKVVRASLSKAPTGIQGLDEVTGGGLPKGRVTLVCGSAGCGKSLLAMEFLVHGAVRFGEPGVCMDFEETQEKLRANVASLGFDLRALAKGKKLLVDFVSVERNQIAESGEYNLEALKFRKLGFIKYHGTLDATGGQRLTFSQGLLQIAFTPGRRYPRGKEH